MRKINKTWLASILTILAIITFGISVYPKVIINNVQQMEKADDIYGGECKSCSCPPMAEVNLPIPTYLEEYILRGIAGGPSGSKRGTEFIRSEDCPSGASRERVHCSTGGSVCGRHYSCPCLYTVYCESEQPRHFTDTDGKIWIPIWGTWRLKHGAGTSCYDHNGNRISGPAYDRPHSWTEVDYCIVESVIADYIKVFPDPAYVLVEKELQFVVKRYGFGENGVRDGDPDPETYAPAGDDTGPIDIEATWATTAPENVGAIGEETGLFQAGEVVGEGKVKASYTISETEELTDEVDVFVLNPEIEEILSDQFENVKANYLPDGSGSEEYGYILMGARSDGKGYVKAKIKGIPDNAFVREKVLVRLDRNGTPEGEGTLNGDNIASMWIDSIHSDDYTVVAGLDDDGDGKLDEDEICATTDYKLKITSPLRYTKDFVHLYALATLGRLRGLHTASTFLGDCFLHDRKPLMGNFSTVNIDIPVNELYHNIGVVFTTSGTGKARKYLFGPTGYLPRKIIRSKDLARWIRVEFTRYRREVQNHKWEPKEKFHTFTWDLPSSGTAFGVDRDLGMAFGDVILKGKMDAKVRRKGLKLVRLDAEGEVQDIYQWDYEEGGDDVRAARVQSGYNTPGKGGHIFKTRVSFSGRVSISYSFK